MDRMEYSTLRFLKGMFRTSFVGVIGKITKYFLSVDAWKFQVRLWKHARILSKSKYFNAKWYLENNPDVVEAGIDPFRHFLRWGWRGGRHPSPDFVLDEYLSLNKDVAMAGVNPLLHYELYGKYENRAVLSVEEKEPIFPKGAREYEKKFEIRKPVFRRTAVFVSYSSNGEVAPYVRIYLRGLKRVADNIIFVTDNPLFEGEMDSIRSLIACALVQRHGEYDFGSYKRGYFKAKEMGLLNPLVVDELIICNDSCYAPVYPFEPIFTEMSKRSCDFWGMSLSKDFGEEFIQSFFFTFKQRALKNFALDNFFGNVTKLPSRSDVVLTYESKFTSILVESGLKYDTWIPSEYTFKECAIPTKRPAEIMKRFHMPLLKVKTLLGGGLEPVGLALNELKKCNRELYEIVYAHYLKKKQGTLRFSESHPIFSYEEQQRSYYKTVERLRNKVKSNQSVVVYFFVSIPSMFPAQPLFESMLHDPFFSVRLVVIPDTRWSDGDVYGGMEKCELELKRLYPLDCFVRIRKDKFGNWPDVLTDADIVCYPSPYDLSSFRYNPHYAVGRDFLPIHVNYGFYRSVYDRALLRRQNYLYFWKVFFECKQTLSEYCHCSRSGGSNAELTGYCKMDMLAKCLVKSHERKRVIIAVHHSVQGGVNNSLSLSNFLRYSEYFLELPKRYPQIDFVFRPHPFLFHIISRNRFWGKQRVEQYIDKMKSYRNLIWSSQGNYFKDFAESDGIIQDCGSYLVEYFYTGKPCCYMLKEPSDIDRKFIELGKQCLENCYLAYDTEAIDSYLDNVILNGYDPMMNERLAFAQKIMLNYPNASAVAKDCIKALIIGSSC